jgi:branched-chain amino acid transport system substrate-binding protein
MPARTNTTARVRSLLAFVVALLVASFALAACGGSDEDSSTGAATSGATQAADTTAAEPATAEGASKCGLGNGEKATGAPIKLGAIVTKQPGTDFSDGPNMSKAFFDCVNDNGGINGRPIEYIIETEQTDPGQVASLAKKLVETDKVMGIFGGFSLIDCAVNHDYYEKNGYYVTNAGIAPECWSTPNSAAINMGPRYSSDGATQALIKQGVDKLVFVQSNVPGSDYVEAGPKALAEAAGIPLTALKENVPIQDANSVALKLVQEAGDGGGVVLNFTPPEALKILQAAQQQGLAERVKWGCSTPCNTDFLAEALGSEWNEQLFVNAELNVVDHDGPDTQLYRQVREEYGPDIPLGSFSQMGFLLAKIAVDQMLTIDGEVTKDSVNEAILATKNYETDILCKPWYYGEAPMHIPNNTDWTTTPKDGKMVIQEDCFEISADDPDIARVREIEQEQGIG